MFLKNKTFFSKIKRSKVTDYAALSHLAWSKQLWAFVTLNMAKLGFNGLYLQAATTFGDNLHLLLTVYVKCFVLESCFVRILFLKTKDNITTVWCPFLVK